MINYDFLFALELVEGENTKVTDMGVLKKKHGFLLRFA